MMMEASSVRHKFVARLLSPAAINYNGSRLKFLSRESGAFSRPALPS
jgi:hypothetical protein